MVGQVWHLCRAVGYLGLCINASMLVVRVHQRYMGCTSSFSVVMHAVYAALGYPAWTTVISSSFHWSSGCETVWYYWCCAHRRAQILSCQLTVLLCASVTGCSQSCNATQSAVTACLWPNGNQTVYKALKGKTTSGTVLLVCV